MAQQPFVVDASHCSGEQPASSEGPAAYYGNCTGHWDWTAWRQTSDCAGGVRTEARDPVCMRGDEADPSGASCDPTAKEQPQTRQQSCFSSDEVQIPILQSGQTVTSRNGRYQLQMRTNGVLAIQDLSGGQTVWQVTQSTPGVIAPAAPGAILNPQRDGNLVTYGNGQDAATALWNSRTWGATGSYYALTDDGMIVIHHPGGQIIWNTTGSSGAVNRWDTQTGQINP